MKNIDTSHLDLRLGNHSRNALIRLKRRTGIQTMNIICRWALCESLAQSSKPREVTSNDGMQLDKKNKKG